MTAPAPDATRPLDEHLLEATTGTLELFGIYLGDRLGLYRALRTAGAVTPDDLAPFSRMLVGIARVLDEVAAAYRTGNGVPYVRYGPDFRSGQGDINRPVFSTALVDEWLPAL